MGSRVLSVTADVANQLPGKCDTCAAATGSSASHAHGAAAADKHIVRHSRRAADGQRVFIVEAAPVRRHGQICAVGKHIRNARQCHRHRHAFGRSVKVGLQRLKVARRSESQIGGRGRGQIAIGIGRDEFHRSRLSGCAGAGGDARRRIDVGRGA